MKSAIAFLVLLAVAAPAPGQRLQYSDPELHYSIKLPEGWRRLPPDVVERASEGFTLQTGQQVPKCEAWFQRTDKPEGAYPYLLVNRQLCEMPRLEETAAKLKQRNQAAVERANSLNGVVSGTRMSAPQVDARRHLIFIETEQTVKVHDTGRIKGRICLFPGKMGVAQLNFYDAANEAALSQADFDVIVDSFAFEPGYDYQSGLVANTPTQGFDFSRVLLFGLIGGILGPLCYGFLKSRNPNSPLGLLRLRVVFIFLIVFGVLELLLYSPSGPVGASFVLGSIVLGVIGFVVLWIRGMKEASPPA